MPVQPLGPQAHRAYQTLLSQIENGQWRPGARLPGQPELATHLGVAVMTLRQALARLEAEGLIVSEHGRGTFVREPTPISILVVDDEAGVRAVLRAHITSAGYQVVEAEGPVAALQALETDPSISLVMSDLAMPTTEVGVDLIRTVRRRWPAVAVAAVTGYPDDLAGLYGTPECPVLVIAKPFRQHQIEEAIGLALQPRPDAPTPTSTPLPERRPVLVTDGDEETRALLRRWVSDYGFEVEEAATGGQALQALQRRQFGHVFLDLHMPGSGPQFGNAIAEAHPHTTVVISTADPEDLFPLSGTVTVLGKPFDLDGLRASLELRRTPIH